MLGYIAAGLLVLVVVCGCTEGYTSILSKSPPEPDPETGIIAWINAINTHDVGGFYDISPREIRDHVSLEQFANENKNNTLLMPDKSITGYKILNETGNTTIANIKVIMFLHKNVSAGLMQTETIPLYLNFEEWYENGEWKVWSIPWT